LRQLIAAAWSLLRFKKGGPVGIDLEIGLARAAARFLSRGAAVDPTWMK
jgi:hypothetical protein